MRNRIAKVGVMLVALLAGSPAVFAQEKNSEHTLRATAGQSAPAASLKDAGWLVGYWEGEGLGGEVEEVWSRPRGSTMMGMFRLLKDGETAFYEILQLVEKDGSLALRVRHFNLDFTAWEEKERYIEFPLVKVEEDRLWFSGLTLQRESADRLTIYLVLTQGSTRREEKFDLRRVDFGDRDTDTSPGSNSRD